MQVVLTERARLDLIRTYNIPAERVVVVHHSMPTESFVRSPSDGAAFRREHGVPEGPAVIVLGYASVLQEAKGLAMLLEAIPNMLALSPVCGCVCVFLCVRCVLVFNLPLCVCESLTQHLFCHCVVTSVFSQRLWILLAGGGTPDVMDRVNAVASSPACGGRLILLGPLTSARMPSFYSAIDVFIDTSLHHTGSNGVLVEAALSGAVLIAPEVGSNRMTNIPDRAMGYTYPPGDARHLVECVRRVLDTPNVLAEVPPLARAHALAGFSLLDMVDR